ncbi:MAG: MATE family efflux transporter [Eubacteriales bacterium]
MSNNTTKENKMGAMPIPKLLIAISLPMIVSMLVQALYNIIDSIFVSKLGEDALTAVSLTFPIQNLIIALSVGTGVGINALISRYLGAKKNELASSIAKHGLLLSFLNFIVFACIGIFFSETFFSLQTDNQTIIDYGYQYMSIICICSIGVFYQITFERIVQSTGKTIFNMIMQGTGAIINIILDPILIFGLFGFPRLEVAGAAIATVIGQMCGALLGYIFITKYTKEVNISLKGFRPNKKAIISIYQIGFPSIIMQSVGSIMVLGMNAILLMFSTTATAVFGVYFKLQSFIFMPIFGLTNGLISIVGYNYGAKNKQRIMEAYKLACFFAAGVMFIGMLVFQLVPDKLLLMFEASDEMLAIGEVALCTISYCFVFAGFCIVTSAMFQALGVAVYSLIVSIARQLFILLPCALVLAKVGGLDMVWYAFPIAEIAICSILCYFIKTKF